jgi:hypothetical protein
MTLTEDHNVVEQFSTAAPDPALGDGILPS